MPSGDLLPLTKRPVLVALNKTDLPDGQDMSDMVRSELEAAGYRTFEVSAVSRKGLRELSFAMAELVKEERERRSQIEDVPVRQVIRPIAVDDAGFDIVREETIEGPIYRVLGSKPQRWVLQTDFSNDEAVGYPADRLERLGVEEQLFSMGAPPGDTIVIGPDDNSVVFDWDPTMVGGAELLGARGTDMRLEDDQRATRKERKAAFHERMDAKAEARAELEAERIAEKRARQEGSE